MDRNTFTDPDVIENINNNFLPVKFDAEYRNTVVFNKNSYKYVSSGRKGINELAYALTNGNLSYPMTVFLDENYQLITLLPGYHKPNFYNLVLKYIGEDHWKSQSWDEYLKNSKKTIEKVIKYSELEILVSLYDINYFYRFPAINRIK